MSMVIVEQPLSGKGVGSASAIEKCFDIMGAIDLTDVEKVWEACLRLKT